MFEVRTARCFMSRARIRPFGLWIRPPPPLPISFIPQLLSLYLTPIELVHCRLFNPCRTVFNRLTLLIAYCVGVDSERDPWVAVP
jgi:hypothetical protein